MTRALARTNFNSSDLVRCLADLSLVEAPEPGHGFAERLGRWLGVNEAMTLYAAHNATHRAVSTPGAGLTASEDFAQVRATLANAISRSCSPQGGGTRLKLPTPQAGAPLDIAASYEPYRRFHLAHQRDMEAGIRPLRARMRQALAAASPELAKLAALDEAFDGFLAERESRLLSRLPLLLEKRFEQLLAAHRQQLTEAQQADDPARWMQPGEWLAGFCAELQAVLLAELDVRLQPALGLDEALSNETTREQ